MKYPKQHKQEVGTRLRRQAARQIRARGMDGVSVKSVMGAEGMTVGGFYAHFDSRRMLLVEALQAAFDETASRYARIDEAGAGPLSLRAVFQAYLSKAHRDRIDTSCPLSSLMGDVVRQDASVKVVFQQGLERLIELYVERLPELDRDAAEALATGLFAMLAGGIQLSRAVADEALADRILRACIVSAEQLLKAGTGSDQGRRRSGNH